MTAEQRTAYEKWHAARDTRQSVRLSRKRAKKQAIEASEIFAMSERIPDHPEIVRLDEKIRLLQQQANALVESANASTSAVQPTSEGIFG